ncbi:GNAT family protein [Arthrobacter sp. H35-D1]|nr:GNAT family protein [Arthrobacter sp. H35-D1]MDJ0314782.1 GNAT family protein [Arthrobacter sp. H35-D1]
MSRRFVAVQADDGFSFGLFAGETVVGRFNVAAVVRDPFQSGVLSYWLDSKYAGRGLVSAAARVVVGRAREEVELHCIEATALLHNVGSQRVLLKAGFLQIGMAPRCLQIAGKWQGHSLYQIALHE